MTKSKEVGVLVQLAVREFHEYWKENGEPHPSSNKYLELNRRFFYSKGVEQGIKITLDGLAENIND